jgi:hypothetical protein
VTEMPSRWEISPCPAKCSFSSWSLRATSSTGDSLYFGFGFEGIATPDARNAVMGRAMSYLLR